MVLVKKYKGAVGVKASFPLIKSFKGHLSSFYVQFNVLKWRKHRVKTWQTWYDKAPSRYSARLVRELWNQKREWVVSTAQVAQVAQGAQVSGWGEVEPSVISAWVEADSLLTDLRRKKKKFVFNYQNYIHTAIHFCCNYSLPSSPTSFQRLLLIWDTLPLTPKAWQRLHIFRLSCSVSWLRSCPLGSY